MDGSFRSGHRQRSDFSGAHLPKHFGDPPQRATSFPQVVDEQNLTPKAVLITHGHFDHMWNAQDVAAEYDCPDWIHPADRHLLSDPMAAISGESAAMLRAQFGLADDTEFAEPADVRDAVDGARIEVDGITFIVDHVPGHTPGNTGYTWKVNDGGRTYDVVLIPSLTTQAPQLLDPKMVDDYLHEFRTLKELPCQVFLGPHGKMFGLRQKYPKIAAGASNPYIDPEGYQAHIKLMEQSFYYKLDWAHR